MCYLCYPAEDICWALTVCLAQGPSPSQGFHPTPTLQGGLPLLSFFFFLIGLSNQVLEGSMTCKGPRTNSWQSQATDAGRKSGACTLMWQHTASHSTALGVKMRASFSQHLGPCSWQVAEPVFEAGIWLIQKAVSLPSHQAALLSNEWMNKTLPRHLWTARGTQRLKMKTNCCLIPRPTCLSWGSASLGKQETSKSPVPRGSVC